MDFKETINAIKILLSSDTEEITVNLEQKNLMDGVTVIEAETFEEGSSIFIVTEDANVPLPVGEYEVEGGMIIVVEEEGTISSITQGEPESEPEEEVKPELETEEVVPQDTPEFVSLSDFQSAIDELRTELNAIKSKFDLSTVELSAKDTEIETLKTKLDEKPATTKLSQKTKSETKTNINRGKGETTFDSILNRINNN